MACVVMYDDVSHSLIVWSVFVWGAHTHVAVNLSACWATGV